MRHRPGDRNPTTRRVRHPLLGTLLLLALATTSGVAQERRSAGAEHGGNWSPRSGDVATQHRVEIGGERIEYRATAGTLPLTSGSRDTLARIFYVSYERTNDSDGSQRPVMFSFNGGPGSSSAWMHLGLLGPWRVNALEARENGSPPPYELVDNHQSLLDVTDLVFVDPVATGYSRAAPGVDRGRFLGYREDLAAVAEFIRRWITENGRWGSPKFLIGESYGSRRAAGLAQVLQVREGMDLNGVVLVSAGSIGRDYADAGLLRHALYLPHFAATAWYHDRLGSELGDQPLPDVLDEVESYALDSYARALIRGNRLSEAERARVAERLARYTGLSASFIERSDLRVERPEFRRELLRGDRRSVGRLDSRFLGIEEDGTARVPSFDPSMEAIRGPFTSGMNALLREELGYETSLRYDVYTNLEDVWTPAPDLDLLESLRSAMARNPDLRVLVADGYFDKLYFWPEFTFSQFTFSPDVRERLSIERYRSGHMMYIRDSAREQMKADLARFVRGAYSDRER